MNKNLTALHLLLKNDTLAEVFHTNYSNKGWWKTC